MTLFNDTELFTSGNAPKKKYDQPDLELIQYDGFIPKEQADSFYTSLLYNTPWREYEMPIYDKVVTAPRMVALYGSSDEAGTTALAWTPELLVLREKVVKETGLQFNAVLLNLYRNGSDSVAWHSDKEHRIGKNPNIASLTLGQTRPFRFRHKTRKELSTMVSASITSMEIDFTTNERLKLLLTALNFIMIIRCIPALCFCLEITKTKDTKNVFKAELNYNSFQWCNVIHSE